MGVENDDSMGRGQGDEMIVLGGAKRKRTEDRLGSEQGDYGGWALSLKMVIKRKQKSSGTFNGTGYNKGLARV